MIAVTRPDGSMLLLNPDRVESIEETPDTVITLADGRKLLVREAADVIVARFTAYQRSIRSSPRRTTSVPPLDLAGRPPVAAEDEAAR